MEGNMKLKCVLLTSFFLTFCIAKLVYAVPFELSADGSAVVRLTPQGAVTAGSLDTSLLNSGWSATTGTGGSLSVTSYTAGFKSGIGGAEIKALYDNGSALGTGNSLQWVQVLNTNDPLGGKTSPYLDNAGKPTQPFYTYTNENRDPTLPANKLNFYDYSKRDPADLSTTNPINWNASLYPVIWDGATGLTVQDGVSWGWTMKKATVGTDTGVFVNPSPATAVVSGVGTNSFSWGSGMPDQSSLTFIGGNFDTTPNTPFKLGTLIFHNGTISSGTGADSVGFNIAVNFDNVPEKNLVLNTIFNIVNTLNTADPIASADYVSIGDYGYTFNVLEGATASADIFAKLSTGLTALPSGALPSGAELFSSGPFDPSPDYTLTLLGFENPSSGGFVVNPVPEPSTFLMIFLGLMFLLWWQRRHAHRKVT